MDLRALAPSVAALPRHPLVETAERPRLTVLTGAGASIHAGAPSTQQLTDLIAARPISGALLTALRADHSTADANFEDVLHVLEELESLQNADSRAARVLKRFVKPAVIINGLEPSHSDLRNERLEVIELVGGRFDQINYDATWTALTSLLQPLLEHFNIDLFTLNYDLLADVAVNALTMQTGRQYFDGFGRAIDMANNEPFRSDQFALWPGTVHMTLAHLHGSLLYSYYRGDQRMAHAAPLELVQSQTPMIARESWIAMRAFAADSPNVSMFGVSPIVAGLRKSEKLLVSPYANYYGAFIQRISKSPRLLLVGYGSGDPHINFWLREFAQIHVQNARIAEITVEADPNHFAVQRYGAYDLYWKAIGPNLFVNRAGIQCMTYNGGFSDNPDLPVGSFVDYFQRFAA